MTRTGWICWAIVAAGWIGTIAYLAGHREPALCKPADNVVVRIAQGTPGEKEAGTVYLNFDAAIQARDGLDTWLHRYGKCR